MSTYPIRRIARAAVTVAAALGLLGGAAVAATSPAATAKPADSTVRAAPATLAAGVTIRPIASRACVTAAGFDGSAILQVGCGSWGHQLWNIVEVPSRPGLYEIQNVTTGKCLEIAGWAGVNGAAAMTWTCFGGAHQRWWVWRTSGGYYHIKNENSGKCLDVHNTDWWIPAIQWDCHLGGEQQFLIP